MFGAKKSSIQQMSMFFVFNTILQIVFGFIDQGFTMKSFIKPILVNFTLGLIFAAVLSAFVEDEELAPPSEKSDSSIS